MKKILFTAIVMAFSSVQFAFGEETTTEGVIDATNPTLNELMEGSCFILVNLPWNGNPAPGQSGREYCDQVATECLGRTGWCAGNIFKPWEIQEISDYLELGRRYCYEKKLQCYNRFVLQ